MRGTVLLVVLAACRPDLGDPPSLITEPRVLAVRSDPPETPTDQDVTYTALVVDPDGTVTPDVAWGFCTEPAPLSSNNAVGDDCIYGASSLPDRGATITAKIPIGACSVFGPTPPAPAPGETPRRPHDADVTGGYYQPVRVLAKPGGVQISPAIALTRITCDLPNVPFEIARDFRARYHANANPAIERVLAQLPGTSNASELPVDLPANAAIPLRVRWTEGSVETFPVFDPESRTLVDHREAIRVSWFVSDGALAYDRTGRTEAEVETFAENVWTTPAAGPAHLWVVVRDPRGGVAFTSINVMIR